MIIAIFSAFWFGILTSISPCPLATNIAAISFLSKRLSQPKLVLRLGFAYIFGRMVTYAVLGVVIITSLTSVPALANFLQRYMNKALGPILVIVGLFLLDIFKFNAPSLSISHDRQKNLAQSGARGTFILGAIFALSFCPLSAGLFFGSLIPLSLSQKCGILLPFFYGIGTALPVVFFSISIALGLKSFSSWFNKLSMFELYARKITGAIFIIVGLYYIYVHIL
ncbi:MAG: sulfite exporter TauE/SafE family protein [Candidatus Omnitrophica bacterium]|nr:sulfite exporter TauE/SafE family protein [Candidatus Omnitrophota bacterium]MBU4590810.1 sulfite exporter TauE/SafE family protein [Candidatus Omnitrophota bacterium]